MQSSPWEIPGEKDLNPPPQVRLVAAFPQPFRNFVATAQTCYSSRGIVTEADLRPNFLRLAQSIYQAGHHTTLQHAAFQFALSGVSRLLIWSFLHSHPFYNSEQVSQRYVTVQPENVRIPPLSGEALSLYQRTIEAQMKAYRDLTELLYPLVKREYLKRFPVGGRAQARRIQRRWDLLIQMDLPLHRSRQRMNREVQKRAQEVARYVLPVATLAYLYHTVNGITLLRYWRLCQQFDTPLEQRVVVGKMVQELLRWDPLFEQLLEEPLPLEATPEWQFFQTLNPPVAAFRYRRHFVEEFDRSLEGHLSRLMDYKPRHEALLSQAVREVLGVPKRFLSDARALRWLLDPATNSLYGETLNLTPHSKLLRVLHHASYTFRKKLSHTADSQDQRHRLVPASRPCLHAHLHGDPDYVVPELIRHSTQAFQCYQDIMEQTWEAIRKLLQMGVPETYVLYLLPNATAIRFTESGDLLGLRHKYTMRLCYNAQEEIWRASLEEVRQIRTVHPRIGKWLLPPCTLRVRAQRRPVCPEGDRYCGVMVWRLPLSRYRRLI